MILSAYIVDQLETKLQIHCEEFTAFIGISNGRIETTEQKVDLWGIHCYVKLFL